MNSDRLCLGCSGILPLPFLSLGNTPLANSNVKPEHADKPEPVFPLEVAYCPSCHLVQLTDTVPPSDLFSDYVYFSSYSDSLLRHAAAMANEYIDRFQLGGNSRVVEIASNDGYLLQYFVQRGIPVLGVEPAGNIAKVAVERGIPTLNRFFEPAAIAEIHSTLGAADLIMGNNVLAHVPSINSFLSAVEDCLKPGGVAVFEFPYLLDLLQHCEFDTIYHEHVFYYSLSAIRTLGERAGLTLLDVSRQPIHGGSLRVFLTKNSAAQPSQAVLDMLANEEREGLTRPERYQSFSRQVQKLRSDLIDMLTSLKQAGKRIAGYAAPAKGNTLLNYCGITTDLIEFTVDRNPHKQNLLLPGSHIPIYAPERLLSEMPDYTVILAWNIAAEVIEQQSEYQARGGMFIVPVPSPQLVRTAANAA